MKIAFLIDPLQQLTPYKDTSLEIMQRAQEKGWECYYFTQQELFCRDGVVCAALHTLKIIDEYATDWYESQSIGVVALHELDIILMRKDPPFNTEYIYTTYLLEQVEQKGVLIANKPQGLRDANEKFFTLNFPQCCPTTLVSRDINLLKEFWVQHKQVIYKPAEGMGGSAVFHVDEQGRNLSVILEILTQDQTRSIIAQRYIPEIVNQGDKRILLINGNPVAYGLARIPAPGELRGNLAAGAQGRVVPLTNRDYWICEQIAPKLQEKGLYFVGIDVIGDFLTEINVTSPTCLKEITRETNIDIAGKFLKFLEQTHAAMQHPTN